MQQVSQPGQALLADVAGAAMLRLQGDWTLPQHAALDRLVQARLRFDAGRERGGVFGRLQQAGAAVSGALTFVRLFLHPVKRHELPAQIRVAPVW